MDKKAMEKKVVKFFAKMAPRLAAGGEEETSAISLFEVVVSALPAESDIRVAIERNLEKYFDLFEKSLLIAPKSSGSGSAKKEKKKDKGDKKGTVDVSLVCKKAAVLFSTEQQLIAAAIGSSNSMSQIAALTRCSTHAGVEYAANIVSLAEDDGDGDAVGFMSSEEGLEFCRLLLAKFALCGKSWCTNSPQAAACLWGYATIIGANVTSSTTTQQTSGALQLLKRDSSYPHATILYCTGWLAYWCIKSVGGDGSSVPKSKHGKEAMLQAMLSLASHLGPVMQRQERESGDEQEGDGADSATIRRAMYVCSQLLAYTCAAKVSGAEALLEVLVARLNTLAASLSSNKSSSSSSVWSTILAPVLASSLETRGRGSGGGGSGKRSKEIDLALACTFGKGKMRALAEWFSAQPTVVSSACEFLEKLLFAEHQNVHVTSSEGGGKNKRKRKEEEAEEEDEEEPMLIHFEIDKSSSSSSIMKSIVLHEEIQAEDVEGNLERELAGVSKKKKIKGGTKAKV